jgi:hypothetical protein
MFSSTHPVVQVLNAHLLRLYKPHGDAYHAKPARNAGASFLRFEVVRRLQLGPLSAVRNAHVVIDTEY